MGKSGEGGLTIGWSKFESLHDAFLTQLLLLVCFMFLVWVYNMCKSGVSAVASGGHMHFMQPSGKACRWLPHGHVMLGFRILGRCCSAD